ncbi:hypothetical protein, partial [Enterobacter intestinihominis]
RKCETGSRWGSRPNGRFFKNRADLTKTTLPAPAKLHSLGIHREGVIFCGLLGGSGEKALHK